MNILRYSEASQSNDMIEPPETQEGRNVREEKLNRAHSPRELRPSKQPA